MCSTQVKTKKKKKDKLTNDSLRTLCELFPCNKNRKVKDKKKY